MKKAPPEAGPKASKQNSQDQYNTPSHSRLITRADYARSAVFEKFRPRDARAIDHRDFRDRAPADEPCRWRPPHQWSPPAGEVVVIAREITVDDEGDGE